MAARYILSKNRVDENKAAPLYLAKFKNMSFFKNLTPIKLRSAHKTRGPM